MLVIFSSCDKVKIGWERLYLLLACDALHTNVLYLTGCENEIDQFSRKVVTKPPATRPSHRRSVSQAQERNSVEKHP